MGLAGVALAPRLMAAEGAPAKIRIAARHFGDNLDAAKRAGMNGVELGVGGPAEKLHIADAAYREKVKEKVKATGIVVSSLSMDLLNGNPMATDPLAPAWVEQCIEAAKDLGAVGMLVPFFGKDGLLQGRELHKANVDALVARMKLLAPKAKQAGVVLGLENTCSAKQNLEILDRIGGGGVGCYYDIGNSTGAGYDVPAEIRELKGRLCMIHFKDGGSYLGEGKVKMEPVAEALKAIDYKGWIVLETACPKDAEADCKRNGDFIRKLMGIAG
jgi:sugar phosphate isomerase/epimerase